MSLGLDKFCQCEDRGILFKINVTLFNSHILYCLELRQTIEFACVLGSATIYCIFTIDGQLCGKLCKNINTLCCDIQ